MALGGGVVGDLAGFAAAITRRGMHLVQMPTTLLAQVDSSVGGKTGINARQGKNLVGAFMQPDLVLADTDALDTLPEREFRAGYAEMAKAGLIGDARFFAWLEENRADSLLRRRRAHPCDRRERALQGADRRRRRARDGRARAPQSRPHLRPRDRGRLRLRRRARLVHGEAVAIGIVLAHDFSVAEGLAPEADAERARRHLKEAGLPVSLADVPGPALPAEELMRHIAQDKKVKRGRLTFILTRGIGKAFIADDVPPEKVKAFLERQVTS